jgi:P-type Cu+ transporter
MRFMVLVKASEVFHGLSEVDTVVFDKPGPLPYGRPPGAEGAPFGIESGELLALAGAVERHSEHPLGQAIGAYVERHGPRTGAAEDFRAVPGKGVTGVVDGYEVLAGKPSFLEERGVVREGAFADRDRAAGLSQEVECPVGRLAATGTPCGLG